MGAFNSRQGIGIEEVDIGINHAYKYPPKSGNYFSSHFIMGGERFDTAQPEMYLFGENYDLNFLGTRPMPFPYPAPSALEPSRTLKSLINVRKESLRFVRVPDNSAPLKEGADHQSTLFNVEFTFDSDVRCSITIMYFCSEEISNSGIVYTPRDPSMNSQTFFYTKGANQQFSQVSHIFDPSKHPEQDLSYNFERDLLPAVIYCKTEESTDVQVHVTIAVVERYSDGYSLKPLKQKLYVDGLWYLLQEIYGIENKNSDNAKGVVDDDTEDNGAECVICMCDLRDTLILPCRHLCLCYSCADSLRYQANNCPICRAPFRALLQIKAVQQSTGSTTDSNEGADNSPAGYEAVSLIEALNGPSDGGQKLNPVELKNKAETAEGKAKVSAVEDSTTQTDCLSSSCESADMNTSSNMKMSSLLAQDSEDALFHKVDDSSGDYFSFKLKKPQFLSEDSVITVTEAKEKEGNELGCINRKLRKSISVSSPVCTDSEVISKKEIKLYRSESAGVDDSGETLSLLQCENRTNPAKECKKINMRTAIGEVQTNDINSVEGTLPNSNRSSPEQLRRNSTHCSSRSKRGRRKRHSSMRSNDCENSEDICGLDANILHGEPSLPGTPLSTTSAVSRISDTSVGSASSTRALIINHPTSSNNSIV